MKKKESKTENADKKTATSIKSLAIFICLVLASLGLGYVAGLLTRTAENDGISFKEFFHNLSMNFLSAVPYMFIGLFVLTVVLCLSFYIKSKAMFKKWNGEDENVIDEADRLLGISMFVNNISFILTLFLFGAQVAGEEYGLFADKKGIPVFCIVSVVVLLAFNTAMQVISFGLLRKMMPEKKGDVLSLSFSKQFNESLDEAELLTIYKSAYRSFQVTNAACMTMWLLCFIGEFIFGLGAAPVAVVTVIWLVLSGSFQIQGLKLEHGKKRN